MSASKRAKDQKKAAGRVLPDLTKPAVVAPVVTTEAAVAAATPPTTAPVAQGRAPSVVKPVQMAILPLMKTAKTVTDLAAAASKKLEKAITERQVRSAIDRARRGANGEPPVNIKRVAPNTFQILDNRGNPKAA